MSLESLFNSGDIAFLALAVIVAEIVFLARNIRENAPLIYGLAAGACLLLALRAALADAHWHQTALFLAGSLLFHIMEVRRWLRPGRV